MSEVADREIREYLDPDRCEHEIKEDTDQTSEDYGVPSHFTYCSLCETVNPEPNPTPTLEWMLGKVVNKKFNNKGYAVEIYKPDMQDGHILALSVPQGSYACEVLHLSKDDIVTYDKTPTLALRGAVEKMMEANSVPKEKETRQP